MKANKTKKKPQLHMDTFVYICILEGLHMALHGHVCH